MLRARPDFTPASARSVLLFVVLLFATPLFADQANVFVYHRFNDPRYPSTNISRADFQAQLELLRQERFTVLRLGEVVAKVQHGESLPPRCAVITVDDAYRSFLAEGWPLLKSYGYPATLFVSTDSVGSTDFLDWQELTRLQDEGLEVGNHSASHAYLLDRLPGEDDAAWAARVAEDLERSQRAFAAHLGAAPRLFAYPYGEFSPQLAALVKAAGFAAAYGQQSGVITAGQDAFRLPRFPVGGGHASLDEFRSKLFMKHLEVQVETPISTVLKGDGPPLLRFYLKQDGVAVATLKCFVQGSSDCEVRALSGRPGYFEVEASRPLDGRRGKYTVTASGQDGRTWYWYSQLWVRPGRGEVTDQPVPR